MERGHFTAKQGNPWRNDGILEALADFGIKALLGWALIDFSSVSFFSIVGKKRETWGCLPVSTQTGN